MLDPLARRDFMAGEVAHARGSVRNSLNPNAATAYLTAHHYLQWSIYQPESRFWHFQLIEGGWLLALSLLLIGRPSGWCAAGPEAGPEPSVRYQGGVVPPARAGPARTW
jgi:hypothetical protein